MAFDKDGFGNENEISRFEEEEDAGADREEIIEAEEGELVITERPEGVGAPPAPPRSPKPRKAKPAKKAAKKRAKRKKGKAKPKKKAGRKAAKRRKKR